MQEITRVTEDSPISSEETKELIERLSDPSFVTTLNQATVKDLAETLDMDPARVIAGLERLRQEQASESPPMIESYFEFNNRRARAAFAKPLAGILIVVALGIMSVLFLVLFRQPELEAPLAPKPAIEAVPGTQKGPMSDAPPRTTNP